MLEKILQAEFEPSEGTLLKGHSFTQLLGENPILASALSNIFPYLLLIDYFLELITWTNDDHYQNFLLVVVFTTIIIYWNICSLFILPIICSLIFSVLVWSISSVINDSKFNEKPTIDEVLHSLYNITIRFELLLRPIKHFKINKRTFLTVFTMAIILTPIHILIVTQLLTPQKVFWIFGCFLLTYHSPWSFSIRRLLWRSVYIRIIGFYLTGLDIKLDRRNQNHHLPVSRIHSPTVSEAEDDDNYASHKHKLQLLSDFKIVRKIVTSPTQLKQIVLFEILENERRWLGIGWAKFLLPNERPNFCYQQSMMTSPHVEVKVKNDDVDDDETGEGTDSFPFPVFENDLFSYLWEWLDDTWSIDKEFNKSKSPEGWCFYDNNWLTQSYEDGITKYTRSRKWIRRAVLIIDKRDEVNDN